MLPPVITIVDYDAGNIRSVKRACDAVGARSSLSRDPEEIRRAERIIFPGVGAAKSAMNSLVSSGLADGLRDAFRKGTPIFGICLGSQIILESSDEGDVACLGLLPGKTPRFSLSDPSLKVPHMGWNEVKVERPHPLLAGIEPGEEFYFVHSFYPAPSRAEDVHATSEHGVRFCSALGTANLFATQFHPEKSGRAGLRMLERFVSWDGSC